MEIKDYYPNGLLEYEVYMTAEGEVREKYYENGQKKYRHVYWNGKPYGTQMGWYEDGKLKYKGVYDKSGKEHGIYERRDENGRVTEMINYIHGLKY